ncbi:N6-L-threonylcarbamoyladenine synthase, TsaD subunit [Campylobacter avium LMG 24591]|uniref:tRNA N6-adenosine threonylcarbamoyltransferase n=1 Tax=Campylobacter avium LMG 24591 TaxID=522484 RepID=A0A222MXF3_9BACT|nr:tRNA (adenosine(37)-N6)-threonylcarbamoyltransferase complex transferase subunit TsaD [Campylobacter avium]ASQ30804.1 N6-L-threonylcarbamoyladenine synthase, TsaD subunit [Campylobacter avium LMG 24591]OYD78616.1 N6-L-threonylcarbamoyladenine synthase, TsaD subunit [Campylobacter avium]
MKDCILAIESSCDDSSIAIMNKDSFEVIFEAKLSQEKEHSKYGGVVPELAARLHTQLLAEILSKCKTHLDRLCAVAVTNEPGLTVSLIAGITMAKTLALSMNLPLIAVNHLQGHIYSLFLDKEEKFDIAILLVSGGHTMILHVDEKGKNEILASTSDDSFGESFDKVAKMMNLSYPGGPVVESLAKEAREKKLNFTVPLKNTKDLKYSFSGLKNQVRLELLKHENLNKEIKSEIAFAFEEAAIAHIIDKLELVFKQKKFKSFGVVGGASANLKLRLRLEKLCEKYECKLKLAPLKYCSDNAVMIARAACSLFKKSNFVSFKDDILHSKNVNFDFV